MSTYDEAVALKKQLSALVNDLIEQHPIVKRTLKATKCVIVSAPNQETHTIKVKLTPFDRSVIELPYAPKIPLSELQPNKVASVWYFYTVNNGIVMQNHMWTAYGQDDLENLANGELNLIESIQILAQYIQQINTSVEGIKTDIETLNSQSQDFAEELQQIRDSLKQTNNAVGTLNTQWQQLNNKVVVLDSRISALENKSNN